MANFLILTCLLSACSIEEPYYDPIEYMMDIFQMPPDDEDEEEFFFGKCC